MSGEASSAIVRFDADFKKVQGTLSVTASHIAWVPKVRDAMDRQNQLLSRVTSECAVVLWDGIGAGRGRHGFLAVALVDLAVHQGLHLGRRWMADGHPVLVTCRLLWHSFPSPHVMHQADGPKDRSR
jgi:hypothetical protein